jgi:hypothetical protein
MKTPFDESGALLSPCRTWRYALWRYWNWQGDANCVMFIGLNPSTADEVENDITISKCIGFAQRWGYGGIYMLNLFAYRATDPMVMISADDPIGPGNDDAFGCYGSNAGLVIAAWGSSVPTRHRQSLRWQTRISEVLNCIKRPVYCLGVTRNGNPRHPSRLSYATKRELFWTSHGW